MTISRWVKQAVRGPVAFAQRGRQVDYSEDWWGGERVFRENGVLLVQNICGTTSGACIMGGSELYPIHGETDGGNVNDAVGQIISSAQGS